MARLMCVADGNNTDAATWAVINGTSYLESEANNTALTTSYVASSTFSPGAITIDGIAVKIANRSGTTGTMSIELYNSTAAASVEGTEVTVNVADVVSCNTTDLNGGWMFFKFGSSVTLAAATNYSVRAKTSSATQVNLFRDATAGNWSRILRTTTTQAPVAGDDRFIMGEWTAAGTMTTRSVTLDDTANTDYGSGSTSVITPALSISNGGEFIFGTAASTAYLQTISGTVVVYNGGVFGGMTSGTRMPTDSSLTITMDCAANVDFGLDFRNGSIVNIFGEQKQRWTTLTSDEATSATSIQVVSTSGWKTSDELMFTPTGIAVTAGEILSVSTVDSSTQVTLSAGLGAAHTGTGDRIGEVLNLTSNITIIGKSSTLGTYITCRNNSQVVLDNITVRYLGSNTGLKRGVDITNNSSPTNTVTLESCCFRGYLTGAYVGDALPAASNVFIKNCVAVEGGTSATTTLFTFSGGNSNVTNFEYSNNVACADNSNPLAFIIDATTDANGIIQDNIATGAGAGFSVRTTFLHNGVTTLTNCCAYGCSNGLLTTTAQLKYFNGCNFTCNNTGVSALAGFIYMDNCNFIGNVSSGISFTTVNSAINTEIEINNSTFRGRTGFSQPVGANLAGGNAVGPTKVTFNNCSFGVTNAHTSSDLIASNIITGASFIFNYCDFASTTEITTTAYNNLDYNSYIGFNNKDQTDGNHFAYIKYATVEADNSVFNTAAPSIKLTPKYSVFETNTKLFTFKVPILNGQTCTPTVYVREDAAYTGDRAKLYVKANFNLGINTDTLIATATSASDGAWEALTGTTAAVTDDGVLEFYITCKGDTGYINIDDFSSVNA